MMLVIKVPSTTIQMSLRAIKWKSPAVNVYQKIQKLIISKFTSGKTAFGRVTYVKTKARFRSTNESENSTKI